MACNMVKSGFDNSKTESIVNEDVAKEYLPLMEERGLFFGTDHYGDVYANQVIEAVNIIENILSTTDFEKETVYFNAIW